ncbi:MAG: tyrosine-type recombinase/integrase [Candidatus Marinimicrobia bacterium]|jgi:integrase|nr:tyrosine-type recombinase/integrase [Candidatus Neomarinimicrobiota bacterium]
MKTPKPRKLKGNYYSRIRPRGNEHFREKIIPLKTDSRREATIRNSIVHSQRDIIANGGSVTLPWLKNNLTLEFILKDAIPEYLSFLKTNGRKESTIVRAEFCLTKYEKVLKGQFPVKDQKVSHIEYFKESLKGEVSDQTINLNLTRVRAFLNWCVDIKESLEKTPKIVFIKVPEKAPSYLTESDMAKIQSKVNLSQYWKDVFRMYWETGMRLREAFKGTIDGNWLVVDGKDSKSGRIREIALQPHHIHIILKMQSKLSENTSLYKGATDWYSIKFKRLMIEIEREHLHFHNLRDTFALMRYLETRDIYQVSKELGHSSVKVTEKYAKFQVRRLAEDFPKLAKKYVPQRAIPLSSIGIRFRDTDSHKSTITDGVFA